ncbi:hypothetical protein ACQP1P_45280 [Dactylosporangium sp. CA-052675]|uniref:hypothetical protein n=1 Tax=Dactylosporangium sp. CA-052675 TaxID=3239927 RepID=UPI003D94F520
MNDSRLRLDLTDLAGEVRNVDLHDRVLRTSRRLGVRRAMTASAAALTVLAGAVGVAFALRPDGAAPAPLPGASTATSATTGATSGPPAKVESSAPPSVTETVLKGTRWYLASTPTEYVVHAVTGADDKVTAHIPGDSNDARCVSQTITVSPSGKRLAWVEGSDDLNGTLKVADTDGSHRQTLGTGVLCLGADTLIWKGDDQLVLTKGNQQHLVDIATRADTALPTTEQVESYSPDGSKVAKTVGQQRVANGKSYKYTPPAAMAEHHDGWSARGLSADGRYVAAGWKGTDPSRRRDTFTIVDTTTGKAVALPGSGEKNYVVFTAGGLVLAHQAGQTVIFDARLQHQGEIRDPAGLQDALLLGFRP